MILLGSTFMDAQGLTLGLVVGVVVVVVLIASFIVGARRKAEEPAPDQTPHSPERDSWATPPSTPGQAPQGDAVSPRHITYLRP